MLSVRCFFISVLSTLPCYDITDTKKGLPCKKWHFVQITSLFFILSILPFLTRSFFDLFFDSRSEVEQKRLYIFAPGFPSVYISVRM